MWPVMPNGMEWLKVTYAGEEFCVWWSWENTCLRFCLNLRMGLGVKLGVKVGAGVREASLNQFYLDREVKKKNPKLTTGLQTYSSFNFYLFERQRKKGTDTQGELSYTWGLVRATFQACRVGDGNLTEPLAPLPRASALGKLESGARAGTWPKVVSRRWWHANLAA